MDTNHHHYDFAAACAAEIINIHLYADLPKSQVFFNVLRTILAAWDLAERDREVPSKNLQPSDN